LEVLRGDEEGVSGMGGQEFGGAMEMGTIKER
jgi:hypothetical protein